MALDKSQLQANILNLMNNAFAQTENGEDVRRNFANSLGNLIDTYVKSALFTIPSGAIVVSGSATSQTNPSPIAINNALS